MKFLKILVSLFAFLVLLSTTRAQPTIHGSSNSGIVWGQIAGSISNQADLVAAIAAASTGGSFATITGLPSANANLSAALALKSGIFTTLAGYGITDAQPLNSNLTSIAALSTTAFGRSLLTQANSGALLTTAGGTTVGQNLFTLGNPSAVTYVRINADNSVSLLSASAFLAAIGGGGGGGDVTQAGTNAFTGTNTTAKNFTTGDNAAPGTGTAPIVLGTNYTTSLASNYTFTGVTGTSGRSKVHLTNCSGTAVFTWTTAAQRSGDPVGTSTSFTPTAGDHTWIFYYDTVAGGLYYTDDNSAVSSGAIPPGMYFRWTTTDLGNKPAGSLVADGTNGTATLTPANGLTDVVMGYGNVAAPSFSPVAGSYGTTQNVTISSSTPSAIMKYTTNGTTPSRSVGTVYSAPVAIAATTTLKALAYRDLWVDSGVTSGVYTISGSSYLVTDDMEYTSGSAAATAGWVITTGAPTWAYTTSPAPLLGTYSLKLSAGDETYFPFTATADVWQFCEVNFSSLASRQYVLSFKDSTGATVLGVAVEVDGTFRLTHGSTLATGGSAGSIVTGTSYFFWAHYVTGTGSNGAAEMYYSTNQTKPGSPTLSLTTGSATTNASRFAIYNAAGTTVADKVRVSATSIGSSPP